MIFNSLPFLVFAVTFLTAYWSMSGSSRRWLCLISSYFFYGWWDYRFLSLLILSTLLDFSVGIALERSSDLNWRRVLLLVSIGFNLGLLAIFKYFNFFIEGFQHIAHGIGWQADWPTVNLILPLGISFYTFQTLSYTIDIYRRDSKAERSLLCFATYVTFFPQLVAGPIVRASEFLPQLHSDRIWSFKKFELGFGLVLLGYFKKVVIADNIASVADHLFDDPMIFTAVNSFIVIVLYSFQIYGDFSGYSDIAIGVALMLGFVFPKNFHFPYFAESFSDFWQRWHITLSTWLRDYVYIPLGGNRNGHLSTIRNLMLTMLLGGLWHGANWTFVVWGGLHGGFLVLQRVYHWFVVDKQSKRPVGWIASVAKRVLRITSVFAIVCFAWVVFRSSDLGQATEVLGRLGGLDGLHPSTLNNRIALLRCCVLVTLFVLGEFAIHMGVWRAIEDRVPSIRILAYASLVWMIALFGSFDGQSFIYFQF